MIGIRNGGKQLHGLTSLLRTSSSLLSDVRLFLARALKPGQVWNLHQWLNHWLSNIIAPPAITENPAVLARAPKLDETEVEPYSVEEVRSLLETAQQRRNSARGAIALALGLRQGEVLGLQWSDLDRTRGH